MNTPQLKTCPQGHQFSKSSDCPSCPTCENARKPETGFLSKLSAPARRALENQGILTIKQLAECSEKDILQFHGMGKASLPKLREALAKAGLTFKAD